MNGRLSLGWAVAILSAESLLIPLMWLIGHRGNNSFIVFCMLFVLCYQMSPDFKTRVDALISRISLSRVRISRRFVVLCGIALFLAVMNILDWSPQGLWNLDWEGGIGTTYSGFLLAVATVLALFCYRRSTQRVARIAWLLFGTLLLFMTIDELSEFHHGLAESVWKIATGRDRIDLVEGVSFWILVLSPFIVSIIIGIFWFIRNVLHIESRLIAWAALSCWVASQALEATIGTKILPHLIEVASEEFLEMLGTILFIVAFFREYGTLQSSPDN